MRPISRRSLLGLGLSVGIGAAAVAEALPASSQADVPRPRAASEPISHPTGHPSASRPPRPEWRIVATESGPDVRTENAFPGSHDWVVGEGNGTRPPGDARRQIQAYASDTSVAPGDRIDFHVTLATPGAYDAAIWRLGWYGGAGARRMAEVDGLRGVTQPPPVADPATRRLECDWPKSTGLRVPEHWMPGFYLGVFTSPDGYRCYAPFVVRDATRRADLCVVLPFTTYQAYNLWPSDNVTGTSLYYGFEDRKLSQSARAYSVSFDRPYMGAGLPTRSDEDLAFLSWAEQMGYDMTYATSLDLHAGRVDPAAYRGLVFPGHDEYWSQPMRNVVENAVAIGTGLAFLGANNMYWRIRVQPSSTTAAENRVVDCYKGAADPHAKRGGPTGYWRSLSRGGQHNEQQLLGVQYVAMVHADHPLVVREAGHWLWAGTGVRNGDEIPDVVGGEADGVSRGEPTVRGGTWTLVSESIFPDPAGATHTQHSSVWETPQGGVVFTAGSLCWTRALGVADYADGRVQRATANVFTRITERV